MKKLFTFSSLLLCSISHSWAQSPKRNYNLDLVQVTETKVYKSYLDQNKSMQVLTAREISAIPAKSTNELLAYIAGVDLRQRGPNGSQSDVSIDGSTFDQVLILLNGVKMSDPQTGHNMMNIPVPITSIERIEVYRGPAARIYGVNALAGAINIITKKPKENEISVQAYEGSSFKRDTSTGDYYHSSGIQATAGIAGDKQSHLISVSHDQGNGFRYNTAYNAYRALYQNNIQIDRKQLLSVTAGYVSNEFGANAFYAAPGDIESKETVQTAIASVGYTYKINPKLSLMPRVSYRYTKDDYIYIRQRPGVYRNIHESNVLTGELHGTYSLEKGYIGAGIESRNEMLNSNSLGERQRNNLGMYAEYKHIFNYKLNAGVGLYGNYNSDYGFQVFPGADVGYAIRPHLKAIANISTGQRLPTYTDLYYRGPLNIGNDQLKPERATFSEIGAEFIRPEYTLRATVFYKYTTQFIDWVRDNDTAKWQPQNFQSISTPGLTLQGNFQVGKWCNWGKNYDLVVNTSYTYLSPKIEESDPAKISKYATDALRHQAIINADARLLKKLFIGTQVRYQYRINANDYTLLDARIAYTIYRNFQIYADINNILDTQYRELASVPLPGRWWTFGIRITKL